MLWLQRLSFTASLSFVCPKFHPTLLLAHAEPKTIKQAMSDPAWLTAMKSEFDALINNGTWSLVPLPPHR
jgi:hypothetical protein